jgi:hypothetical protein
MWWALVLCGLVSVSGWPQLQQLGLTLDVESGLTCAQLRCLASWSVSAVVPRLWMPNGTTDPNFAQTYGTWADPGCDSGVLIQYALAFPCAGGTQDAVRQAYAASAAANGTNLFGLFLAVLPNAEAGCGWSSDHAKNCNFVLNWLIVSPLIISGIYTTQRDWAAVMGDQCSDLAEPAAPDIWYLDGDHTPSFDDWIPFGAWNSTDSGDLIFAKRYSSHATICDVDTNLNAQILP